jgi:hypothetical protein
MYSEGRRLRPEAGAVKGNAIKKAPGKLDCDGNPGEIKRR